MLGMPNWTEFEELHITWREDDGSHIYIYLEDEPERVAWEGPDLAPSREAVMERLLKLQNHGYYPTLYGWDEVKIQWVAVDLDTLPDSFGVEDGFASELEAR